MDIVRGRKREGGGREGWMGGRSPSKCERV